MNATIAMEMCQLADADATRALGRQLAARLLKGFDVAEPASIPRSPHQLLLLRGELGAGKTCLVQGLAEGLGITEPITSPTFALAHHYRGELPISHIDPCNNDHPMGRTTIPTALVHLDLYRLDVPASADELFAQEEEEALTLSAVFVVEWPERLSFVPEPSWRVELAFAREERIARVWSAVHGDTTGLKL